MQTSLHLKLQTFGCPFHSMEEPVNSPHMLPELWDMTFVSLLGRACLQIWNCFDGNKEAKHHAYTWYTASPFQCISARAWHDMYTVICPILLHQSWHPWHSCIFRSGGNGIPGSAPGGGPVQDRMDSQSSLSMSWRVAFRARARQKRKKRSVSHTQIYFQTLEELVVRKELQWEILQDSGLFCMHFFEWF